MPRDVVSWDIRTTTGSSASRTCPDSCLKECHRRSSSRCLSTGILRRAPSLSTKDSERMASRRVQATLHDAPDPRCSVDSRSPGWPVARTSVQDLDSTADVPCMSPGQGDPEASSVRVELPRVLPHAIRRAAGFDPAYARFPGAVAPALRCLGRHPQAPDCLSWNHAAFWNHTASWNDAASWNHAASRPEFPVPAHPGTLHSPVGVLHTRCLSSCALWRQQAPGAPGERRAA
jgi:hypothetical protein